MCRVPYAIQIFDAPLRKVPTVAVQRTYMAKPGEVQKQWHVVDADDEVLGRLASDIAVVLMGKHRPEYTPHVDCGDFVIVTNVEKIAMTGNKMQARHYTWYTGYPGLRLESYQDRQERKPEDLLRHAVRRMLPKNRLARQMLAKLKIYAGPDHPHTAQQPTELVRQSKKVNN
ncbi:50S ribosomal protein L13 [Allorhodopirellula solitaria]|uniref:Large ribosomal subunit protein uL13 n=2 Tax=Allorhodopirellula solitaria TaxID=2527987 RepID=A0A5C5XS29_9BACT|nr:50S ribosomal protein L13 [Allorhodopirellula solitaria]